MLTANLLAAALAVGPAGARPPASPARAASMPARVTLVDGGTLTGRIVALTDAAATFATARGTRKLPLRDVLRMRLGRSADVMAAAGRKVIVLVGGGRLAAETISVARGTIRLGGSPLGDAEVSLSAVREVYVPGPGERPAAVEARHRKIKLPRGSKDYLVAVDKKGDWVPVVGTLKDVTAGRVTFNFDRADRTIDLDSIRVIQLARVPRRSKTPAGTLIGTDGSVVPFASIRLTAGALSLKADGLKVDKVPLSAVAEVRFRSDRAVYLSDLKPASVVQAGMFEVVFPFRADRSAAGGLIRLGQETYSKGLGMHSRCELTWRLDGKFALLAGVAGIDRAAAGRGNATLRIIGDGKDLVAPLKLIGGGRPVTVRCRLSGVKELRILADFGADKLDVGDHVSFADARLIRP